MNNGHARRSSNTLSRVSIRGTRRSMRYRKRQWRCVYQYRCERNINFIGPAIISPPSPSPPPFKKVSPASAAASNALIKFIESSYKKKKKEKIIKGKIVERIYATISRDKNLIRPSLVSPCHDQVNRENRDDRFFEG